MSMRPPRRKVSPEKRAAVAAGVQAEPYELVLAESVPSVRKDWGTSAFTYLGRRDAYGPTGAMVQVNQPGGGGTGDPEGAGTVMFQSPQGRSTASTHGRKKEKQWSTWSTEILPSLLAPYLSLLRETDSFHNPILSTSARSCDCLPSVRRIDVACVYFESEYANQCFMYIC
jgi:hypothetical protein